MNNQKQTWINGLRSHVAKSREKRPLADRKNFNLVQERQCRIVGGALLLWLREIGPKFLEERDVLGKLMQLDADPLIVFTSNMPGVVAADQIIGGGHEDLIFLFDNEFEHWIVQQPDSRYRWHVHMWSRFLDQPDEEFAVRAATIYPARTSEQYWQHREGTMWACNAGREVDHLWLWNGSEASLLEEAFESKTF